MYFVDRSVAIIQPKKPFLDWLQSVEDNDLPLTLEQMRSDSNVILIPQFDLPEEGISYIDEIYLSLFKMELSTWYEDESVWPQNLSLQLFWEMFDVTIHSMVIDSVEDDLNNTPIMSDSEIEPFEE